VDFSFFTTVGRRGLALYDVRYQGERIIYELTLQEALAHYAGVNVRAGTTAWLDVSIGFTPGKLVPGYDCPSYATYAAAGTYCIFEFPKDFPTQRHTDGSYEYHVTRNIAFLLRAVSTVGNYDYQLTYEFYLDGSIQVIVRASGFIAWTDWTDDPLDPSYGYHIRPNISGSMHDHVLNFKLDLDVHGTANSVLKTEFIPESTIYHWSNGRTINTMRANRSLLPSEDHGKINWSPNAAASYAVVNTALSNAFGEYPGYRISPSIGSPIHSTVINSTLLNNTINWATHDLYALRRKDTEPSSTYLFNRANIDKPLVDFNTFFDGESLAPEDIVLYFNLGMHHMPATEDLPTTVFTNAQSGIVIRPQNYLMRDPSQDSRQQVDIVVAGLGKEATVEEYGQGKEEG
jgi:primary-amine oxidase